MFVLTFVGEVEHDRGVGCLVLVRAGAGVYKVRDAVCGLAVALVDVPEHVVPGALGAVNGSSVLY